MRGGKSFLILLVLALGIGAYAYFVESKRETSDSPETKRDKVWTIDSSKIEEIDIKAANGELTKLKKNGTTWQIVAPQTMEADQDAVSTITMAVSSLESSKTIDDKPASAKPYDLDPPRATVSVKVSGDATPKQLELGSKTPTGSDLYARLT